jgi:hypothetical protein
MNFTATVPPPNWQVPGSEFSFRAATRMPERKNDYVAGDVLEEGKTYSSVVSRAV